MENWKDIKGYEGYYQVSNEGRVRSLKRTISNNGGAQELEGKTKSTRIKNSGYEITDLYKNGERKTFMIHRLVADAFIPNHDNKSQVNHIDGNKLNNRVDNLEWVCQSENVIHSYECIREDKSNINAVSAMNKANSKKVMCLNDGSIYNSASEAAKQVGISSSLLMRCCRGERKSAGKDSNNNKLRWKYV